MPRRALRPLEDFTRNGGFIASFKRTKRKRTTRNKLHEKELDESRLTRVLRVPEGRDEAASLAALKSDQESYDRGNRRQREHLMFPSKVARPTKDWPRRGLGDSTNPRNYIRDLRCLAVETRTVNGFEYYRLNDYNAKYGEVRLIRNGGLPTPKPHDIWTTYTCQKYSTQSGIWRSIEESYSVDPTSGQGLHFVRNREYFYPISWYVPNIFSSQKVAATAIANTKILKNMQNTRNAVWDAGVAIGEARETMRSFVTTARRLANAYLTLRRGDMRAFVDLVGDIGVRARRVRKDLVGRPTEWEYKVRKRAGWHTPGALWMEYSYGWKPLLADVDSAAKYFAQRCIDRRVQVQKLTGRHVIKDEALTKGVFNGVKGEVYSFRETSVKISALLRPRFSKEPDFLEQCGFTDPWSVAWELLPLSFVVDWFVNVGQVLSSLAEFKNWDILNWMESSAYRHIERLNVYETRPNFAGFNTHQTISATAENVNFQGNRQLLPIPTSLDLHVRTENPFTLAQMTSSLALLQMAFSHEQAVSVVKRRQKQPWMGLTAPIKTTLDY